MKSDPVDIHHVLTQLLMNHPFWGSLAMGVKYVPSTKIDTLQFDGQTIFYNVDYLSGLTLQEQLFVVAHEVNHGALGHLWRRSNRAPEEWNVACDYVANAVLVKAKVGTPPKGILYDSQYDSMFSEQVFSKRAAQKVEEQHQEKKSNDAQEQQSGSGEQEENEPGEEDEGSEGSGDQEGSGEEGESSEGTGGAGEGQSEPQDQILDSPTGDFVDGAMDEADGKTEEEWQVATEQAMRAAIAAGSLPGGVEGSVLQAREPRVDWVSELREFVQHVVPSDYSWTTPDRRFVSGGLYLPGQSKNNLGVLAIAVDVSGSTMAMIPDFAKEVGGIISEARPERVYVIYCDAAVRRVDEFTPDDFDMQLHPLGFGGTRFTPVWDYVRDNGIDVQAMVYLTDLECGDEKNIANDPGYPMLWCCPDYTRNKQVAFGQVVSIPIGGRR